MHTKSKTEDPPLLCLSCNQPPPRVKDTVPLICGLCWYCRNGIKPPEKKP